VFTLYISDSTGHPTNHSPLSPIILKVTLPLHLVQDCVYLEQTEPLINCS